MPVVLGFGLPFALLSQRAGLGCESGAGTIKPKRRIVSNENDLHGALRAASQAARFHSIRVGLQDLMTNLDTIEEFIRVSETAVADRSGTIGMLTFELQLLRDLRDKLDVAAPGYLIAHGDRRDEDLALYQRFERRRAALNAWYTDRLRKWRSLGYDPETLVLDDQATE
jgi:hypothetical protein